MACQIIRNKETKNIDQVLTPNGEPSSLFNQLKSVIADTELAAEVYLSSETDSFKKYVVDKNLNPTGAVKGLSEKVEKVLSKGLDNFAFFDYSNKVARLYKLNKQLDDIKSGKEEANPRKVYALNRAIKKELATAKLGKKKHVIEALIASSPDTFEEGIEAWATEDESFAKDYYSKLPKLDAEMITTTPYVLNGDFYNILFFIAKKEEFDLKDVVDFYKQEQAPSFNFKETSSKDTEDYLKKEGIFSPAAKQDYERSRSLELGEDAAMGAAIEAERNALDFKASKIGIVNTVRDQINETLNDRLKTILREFGFDVREMDDLSDIGIDALAATDILNKVVVATKDESYRTLPREAAYVIYKLLGKKNKLTSELRFGIKQWSKYNEKMKEYRKTASWTLAREQVIIDFLAEALQRNFEAPKDSYEGRQSEDWSRKDFETIFPSRSWLEKMYNRIKMWLKRMFRPITEETMINLADDIANDVLTNNLEKFRVELDPDQEQVYYEQTLAKDPRANEIVNFHEQQKILLCGSLQVRSQGTIYRSKAETLHDLDFVVPFERFTEDEKKELTKIISIEERLIKDPLEKKRRLEAFSNWIMNKFTPNTDLYKETKKLFPNFQLLNGFVGPDNVKNGKLNGITVQGVIDGEFYKSDGTHIDDKGNRVSHKKGDYIRGTGYWIDWFYYFQTEEEFKDIDNFWKLSMKAKIQMGRGKDMRDLVNFRTFKTTDIRDAFNERGFRHFTFSKEKIAKMKYAKKQRSKRKKKGIMGASGGPIQSSEENLQTIAEVRKITQSMFGNKAQITTAIDQVLENVAEEGIPAGLFLNGISYINADTDPETIKRTAFHENFHMVFRTLLTDSQAEYYLQKAKKEMALSKEELNTKINDLRKELKSNASNFNVDALTYEDLENLVYEEYLSDNYEEFAMKNKQPKNWLQALYQLIKNLYLELTGQRSKVESLFNRINNRGFYFKKQNSNRFMLKLPAFKLLKNGVEIDKQQQRSKETFARESESNALIHELAGRLYSKMQEEPDTRKHAKTFLTEVMKERLEAYKDFMKRRKKELVNTLKQEGLSKDVIKERLQKDFQYKEAKRKSVLFDPTTIHEDKTKNIDIIFNEITKLFRRFGYTVFEEETIAEAEKNETAAALEMQDKTADELNPIELMDQQLREFIGLTLYRKIDPLTGVTYDSAVDGYSVYTGLLRALKSQDLEGAKFMEKFERYARDNEQSKAVFQMLAEKVGYIPGQAQQPLGYDPNHNLINLFRKNLDLENIDYRILLVDPETGNTQLKKAANLDDVTTQMENWEKTWNDTGISQVLTDSKLRKKQVYLFEKYILPRFLANKNFAKNMEQTLDELSKGFVVENYTLNVTEKGTKAKKKEGESFKVPSLEELTGIKLSKGYLRFIIVSNIAEQFRGREAELKTILTPADFELLNDYGDLEVFIPNKNNLAQIKSTMERNTLTDEVIELIGTEDFRNIHKELSFEKDGERQDFGVRGTLRNLAEGNMLFDENLMETSFQDAKNNQKYGFTKKSLQVSISRWLRKPEYRAKLLKDYPFLTNHMFLSDKFFTPEMIATIFDSKFKSIAIGDIRQSNVDTYDAEGNLLEKKSNRTTEEREGETSKTIDFKSLHILVLSLFAKRTSKIVKTGKEKGNFKMWFSEYYTKVFETKSTDLAHLLPVGGFDKEGNRVPFVDLEGNFTKEAMDRVFHLFEEEYAAIAREEDNIIAGLEELANNTELITYENEDGKVIQETRAERLKSLYKDRAINFALIDSLESLDIEAALEEDLAALAQDATVAEDIESMEAELRFIAEERQAQKDAQLERLNKEVESLDDKIKNLSEKGTVLIEGFHVFTNPDGTFKDFGRATEFWNFKTAVENDPNNTMRTILAERAERLALHKKEKYDKQPLTRKEVQRRNLLDSKYSTSIKNGGGPSNIFLPSGTDENSMREALEAYLISQRDGYYKELTDYGVIEEDANGQILQGNLPVLPEYTPFKGADLIRLYKAEDGYRQFINDFFINHFINVTAYNNLVDKDPRLRKNPIDAVKRNGGSVAYGDSLGEGLFNVAYMKDQIVLNKFGSNTEIADGQAWMSTDRYIFMLTRLGRHNEIVQPILEKIRFGEEVAGPLTWAEKERLDKFNATLNSVKGVFFDGEAYHKLSYAILSRDWTSMLKPGKKAEAKKLMERIKEAEAKKDTKKAKRLWTIYEELFIPATGNETLHELRMSMVNFEVDEILPESASKLKTPVTAVNENGMFDFSYSKTEHENRHWRLQVETPSGKSKITYFSQVLQLIDNEQDGTAEIEIDGELVPVSKIIKDYRDTLATRVKYAVNEAMKELGIVDEEGKLVKPNLDEVLKTMYETLIVSGADDTLLEFFRERAANGVDPKYNLNISPTRNKFEQLFLAHFSTGVLQAKVPGGKVSLVSEFGQKQVYKLDDPDKKIITKKELRKNYNKYHNADGTLKEEYGLRRLNYSMGYATDITVRLGEGASLRKTTFDKDLHMYLFRNNKFTEAALNNAGLSSFNIKDKEGNFIGVNYEAMETLPPDVLSRVLFNIIDMERTVSYIDSKLYYSETLARLFDNEPLGAGDIVEELGRRVNQSFSEVLLPAWSKEVYRLEEGQVIDENHAAYEEIKKMFGTRIPSQDKHSMIAFKVVDFLPVYMGDSGVFPLEIIELSGADFDIDSLYMIRKDYYVMRDTKGRVRLYVQGKMIDLQTEQDYKDFVAEWNAAQVEQADFLTYVPEDAVNYRKWNDFKHYIKKYHSKFKRTFLEKKAEKEEEFNLLREEEDRIISDFKKDNAEILEKKKNLTIELIDAKKELKKHVDDYKESDLKDLKEKAEETLKQLKEEFKNQHGKAIEEAYKTLEKYKNNSKFKKLLEAEKRRWELKQKKEFDSYLEDQLEKNEEWDSLKGIESQVKSALGLSKDEKISYTDSSVGSQLIDAYFKQFGGKQNITSRQDFIQRINALKAFQKSKKESKNKYYEELAASKELVNRLYKELNAEFGKDFKKEYKEAKEILLAYSKATKLQLQKKTAKEYKKESGDSWKEKERLEKEVERIMSELTEPKTVVNKLYEERNEELAALKLQKQLLKEQIFRDAATALGMPGTFEDFKNAPVEKTINPMALHNKLVDYNIAMYLNKDIVDITYTPASMTKLHGEKGKTLGLSKILNWLAGTDAKGFEYNTILGQMLTKRSNKMGKALVGPAAVANIVKAALARTGVKLDLDLVAFDKKVYNTFKEYTSFDIQYEVSFDESGSIMDIQLVSDEEGKVVEQMDRIMDELSTILSAMTDNAKHNDAAQLNFDLNTVGIYLYMISLGMGMGRATLLAKQPAMVEFAKTEANKNSAVMSREDAKKAKLNSVKAVYSKYSELIKEVRTLLEDKENQLKEEERTPPSITFEDGKSVSSLEQWKLYRQSKLMKERINLDSFDLVESLKFTKSLNEDLEMDYNNPKFLEKLDDMSYSDLLKLLNTLFVQSIALDAFSAIKGQAEYFRRVSDILGLNRGLKPSFHEQYNIIETLDKFEVDVSKLREGEEFTPEESKTLRPFSIKNLIEKNEDVKELILAHDNIMDAATHIFLSQSKLFTDTVKNLQANLHRKGSSAKNIKSIRAQLTTFLTAQAVKQHYYNKQEKLPFDYSMLFSISGNTIIDRLNKTIELAREQGYDLSTNLFIQALRRNREQPSKQGNLEIGLEESGESLFGGEDYFLLDLLEVNTRTRNTPDYKSRVQNAFRELMAHEAKDADGNLFIQQFANDLYGYLFVRHALEFRHGSYLQFIAPEMYNELSNIYNGLTEALQQERWESTESKKGLETILGMDERTFKDTFFNLYGRNSSNKDMYYRIENSDFDDINKDAKKEFNVTPVTFYNKEKGKFKKQDSALGDPDLIEINLNVGELKGVEGWEKTWFGRKELQQARKKAVEDLESGKKTLDKVNANLFVFNTRGKLLSFSDFKTRIEKVAPNHPFLKLSEADYNKKAEAIRKEYYSKFMYGPQREMKKGLANIISGNTGSSMSSERGGYAIGLPKFFTMVSTTVLSDEEMRELGYKEKVIETTQLYMLVNVDAANELEDRESPEVDGLLRRSRAVYAKVSNIYSGMHPYLYTPAEYRIEMLNLLNDIKKVKHDKLKADNKIRKDKGKTPISWTNTADKKDIDKLKEYLMNSDFDYVLTEGQQYSPLLGEGGLPSQGIIFQELFAPEIELLDELKVETIKDDVSTIEDFVSNDAEIQAITNGNQIGKLSKTNIKGLKAGKSALTTINNEPYLVHNLGAKNLSEVIESLRLEDATAPLETLFIKYLGIDLKNVPKALRDFLPIENNLINLEKSKGELSLYLFSHYKEGRSIPRTARKHFGVSQVFTATNNQNLVDGLEELGIKYVALTKELESTEKVRQSDEKISYDQQIASITDKADNIIFLGKLEDFSEKIKNRGIEETKGFLQIEEAITEDTWSKVRNFIMKKMVGNSLAIITSEKDTDSNLKNLIKTALDNKVPEIKTNSRFPVVNQLVALLRNQGIDITAEDIFDKGFIDVSPTLVNEQIKEFVLSNYNTIKGEIEIQNYGKKGAYIENDARKRMMNHPTYGIEKIISGGQTGGDLGGLKAASELKIQTGGTAPRGFEVDMYDKRFPIAKGQVEEQGEILDFPNNAEHDVKATWQKKAGQFRKELIKKGITSTYDAILKGYRTGTSRNNTQNVKVGQIINVGKKTKKESLPIYARVTKVYDKTLGELLKSGEMTKAQWSKREGWTKEYIDANPGVLNKYPIDFEVLVQDENGIISEKLEDGLTYYPSALTEQEQKEFYEFGKAVLESNAYNPFPNYVMASAGQMEWSPRLVVSKQGKPLDRGDNYNKGIESIQKNKTGKEGSEPRWEYHYYLNNVDGTPIAPIPNNIIKIIEKVTGQDLTDIDTVLINLYPEGRNLGWHTDITEDYRNLDRDIISVSIGANANFEYHKGAEGQIISGDPSKKGLGTKSLVLSSGDVLTFGEESRLIHHTVNNISGKTNLGPINLTKSNTNKFFKGGLKLKDNWRMNFTFRVAAFENNNGKKLKKKVAKVPVTKAPVISKYTTKEGETKMGRYNPELRDKYGLEEDEMGTSYVSRTKENVKNADATIVFYLLDSADNGTARTIHYAHTGKWTKPEELPTKLTTTKPTQNTFRPVLVLDLNDMQDTPKAIDKIRKFIQSYNGRIKTLNIAGHRQRTVKKVIGDFEAAVKELLVKALQNNAGGEYAAVLDNLEQRAEIC